MSKTMIEIEPDVIESVPFKIGAESFEAYPVSVLAFMEFTAQTNKLNGRAADSEEVQSAQGVAMFELFRSTMEPEEYDRFSAFARNPRNGVSTRVLLSLITKLVEASAARPSEPPSPSPTKQGRPAATSKAS